MVTTTHSLSPGAFAELASGAGGSTSVAELRAAELSTHLMLLRVVAEAASAADSPSPAILAFRAGYRLLAEVQAADPAAVARLLGLPHIGSWAHDCLARLDSGLTPDFGYLAAAAAAAAIRCGIRFDIDAPVTDGRVPLPGLGCLEAVGEGDWIRLSCDGERLRAGRHVDVGCAALVPDDGSAVAVPHWLGTPLVRASADGRAWEVLLETADRHLDRYALPMLTALTAVEVAQWRQLIQSAWELLVRHHPWAAEPIADWVPVIVPLVPRSDLDSATSPAAVGAVATSLPPSPVSMAETLVHEFQHTKLCSLTAMLPLTEPCSELGYAPWRDEPRPLSGLLQGVYAFCGIVRFWDVQRRIETEPDDVLRASVLYEHWRSAVESVIGALLGKSFLTPTGARFVTALGRRAESGESEPVSERALEIAAEVALDHWLNWQLTYTALDAAGVAGLADAYCRSESPGSRLLPESRIEGDEIRKVDSVARSRLLNMRYQDPRRHRQLTEADLPQLGAADALLVRGNASEAAAAYRERLAAESDPAAWIGLALAIHRLPASPSRSVLASHLPLLFELHACLARRGVHADPLDLAAWFQ